MALRALVTLHSVPSSAVVLARGSHSSRDAARQVLSLPEVRSLNALVPVGTILRGRSQSNNKAAMNALILTQRMQEILGSFPPSAMAQYSPPLLSRAIAAAESCVSLPALAKYAKQLRADDASGALSEEWQDTASGRLVRARADVLTDGSLARAANAARAA